MTTRWSDADHGALREFWRFFSPQLDVLGSDVRERILGNPRLRPLVAGGEEERVDPVRTRAMGAAIVDGLWEPYEAELRQMGVRLAERGISYSAWFQLGRAFRDAARARVQAFVALEPAAEIHRAGEIGRGMHLATDHILEHIGDAYFSALEQAGQTLRRTQEQLHHAQKMEAFGRLAGGVAHDFNNILTVVESYACMLQESCDADDPRRADAREIQKAAERAAALTRQLLALGRQSKVTMRSIRLDEVVEAFTPMMRRLAGDGVAVDLRVTATPPQIFADIGQIEQVVMNLIVNARDAMSGRGRLTVEVSRSELDVAEAAARGVEPGAFAVLAISDTGSGMDEATQQRIFDPFFTTKEVGKGTGLGLSIVHGIIAQAGGGIDVYSQVGHGTTFTVRLPSTIEKAVVAIDEHPRAPAALRALNVLVVDDKQELRTLIHRILADAGCTALEAGTCAEARALCMAHLGTIDAALVDLALPDGRGDLLAHELRGLRPDLEVVLMSGFPAASIRPTGRAPAALLAKPFTPAQLRETLAAVVNSDGASRRRSEPTLQPRVLLVDDDATVRRMLSRLLKRLAFEVVEVDSGRKALAAIDGRGFDVVLSDVHMPDGDGLELLRGVRRVDLDVPVILMSGKPDVQSAARALEFGAFRYVTKPLDTEELEKLVMHAVRSHALARMRREAASVTGAQAGASDRAGLEVRLESAMTGLWLAFQPIVHARSGKLYGVEALMRSREPSLPNPPAVLDAAVQVGRIAQVGRRVRALAAAAVGPRTDVPSVFVNLHPAELMDAELVDPTSPLTPLASRVVLEVTEREALDGSTALLDRLARLRELGFRIAVDDIGAGYSGLTSFADLRPEIVKIDMSLIRSVHTSQLKQRTIRALCSLCHEIGTLVVAEGVETRDERDCLVDLQADLFQGYLIARPDAALPSPPEDEW